MICMYVVTKIIHFVKGFFKNATLLCSKQLVQLMLLRKHVSIPTKFYDLNLLLALIFKKKLSKSSHSICYQNTKDLNVNLMIIHIPEANVQLIEKFVMFVIKKTISKFAAQVFVKKSTWIWKTWIWLINQILTKSRMKKLY